MMENKFLLLSALSIAAILSLYCGLVFFFWKSWRKQATFYATRRERVKVSVILAVRNEESCIETCLESLIQQQYPADLLEIICVNDASTDRTVIIIENFQKSHPTHLIRLLHLPTNSQFKSPKKSALLLGVQQSNADFLLFTDADCVANPEWINSMLCFYKDSDAQMICGPVEMLSKSNGLLATFERLDFHSLQLSGGASLSANKPLLCNGANLGIKRETYLSVLPKVSQQNLASGDDMFMMLAIDQEFPGSVKYIKSVEAKVYTASQPNFISLLNQRKRWASKGFLYQDFYLNVVSGIVLLSAYSIVFGISLSFFYPSFLYFMTASLLVKTLFDSLLLNASPQIFKCSKNPFLLLLIEILQAFFILLVSFSTLKKSYSWKNRKLN